MKKITSVLLTALMLVSGALISGELDFSGDWVLDETKLEAPDGGRGQGRGGQGGEGRGRGPGRGGRGRGMMAGEMAVKQEKNKLTIERFISNEWMGDVTQVETLSLDGKKSENEMGFGIKTSTAKITEDGKSLIIDGFMEVERGGNYFEIYMTDTWSLEDGGKVLKIHTIRETPRGDREMTIYYNKK